MERAWTQSAESVLHHFGSSAEKGLSEEQASKARDAYGPNGAYFADQLSQKRKLRPSGSLFSSSFRTSSS